MPPGLKLLSGGLFGSERAFGSATAGNGTTAARAAAKTRRFATARMGVLRPDHSRPLLEIVRPRTVARGRDGLSRLPSGPIPPACRSRSRSSRPAGRWPGRNRRPSHQRATRHAGGRGVPAPSDPGGARSGAWKVEPSWSPPHRYYERKPPRSPEAPWRSARGERGGRLARDLEDQLAQDRGLEGCEIGSRDDEGAGAPDHVLGVVAVEGHLDRGGRAVGVRAVVHDRQAVDDDAPGDRLVTRLGHGAATVVDAVA